ncbi:hypothetical protein D917_07272 [Trichinella nativa]|uniref:Uncharacterized protein n=1 Tax=Trichinella nativa TaxID=6335 RepID=A0A1Y3EPZ7_9BILA|nr:hypothetical protein D917_07272 [Trichinella nativa]
MVVIVPYLYALFCRQDSLTRVFSSERNLKKPRSRQCWPAWGRPGAVVFMLAVILFLLIPFAELVAQSRITQARLRPPHLIDQQQDATNTRKCAYVSNSNKQNQMKRKKKAFRRSVANRLIEFNHIGTAFCRSDRRQTRRTFPFVNDW